MSFQFEQKIGNKVYVYEVQSFWDKKKKQPRQKRTYLGRKDQKTGKIIPTQKRTFTASSSLFGSVYLLKKITSKLKLTKILSQIFPESYKKYLSLAFYKVIQSDPYYLYPYWKENQYSDEVSSMSSQMISDSLSDLGQREDLIELFFKKWITCNNEKGSVMFDITSLSSYSKSNELLELGYNRDKERLKQLNLGMIGKREEGHGLELPLAYRIYSGSIRDVSTLENMISLINQYRLNVTSFVMDRGFFSQQNIRSMNKEDLFFLLPLPYTTSIARNISFAKEDQISSPLSSFSFRKSIYFYTQKEVSIHGVRCFLHMYLDKLRRSQEESKLVSKIIELELKFKKKSFSNIQEAETYIQEALKSKKRFFLIKKKRTKYILKRNEEALKKETLLMGKWILITNPEFDS